MADRAGGTYTPNRKPRRGRGAGNTPRGSPRGRGGNNGDNGESSPSVSSTSSPASSTPTHTQQGPPPVPPLEVKPPVTVTVTPVTPTEGQRSLGKRSSIPKEEPIAKTSYRNIMESPQDRAVTPASSLETFSTPTSSTEDNSSPITPSAAKDPPKDKAEKIKEETPVEVIKPAEPSVAPAELVAPIPDKPPRKTSQSDKTPKVYEALPPEDKPTTPRPTGDPPLVVTIDTEPDAIQPAPKASSEVPASSVSGPSGGRKSVTSSVSPGGYAYGLGGPVGRPGYGVSTAHGDGDDPWPAPAPKARRASIAEITKAAKGFTGRQWITLIMFGLADCVSAMLVSLQAPFYPPEAESKGATATQYGLVFGIYELTVFLVSPFYGKYMNKLGPKLVFNLGIGLSSISCICFGLLDRIDDPTMFIALSFFLRITEAIGAAAFVTSTFTIIACEFPESVATTFASLETFFGLGLIIGPTFGGAMYQLGGFMLPFVVIGVILLVLAILSSFVMPKIETISNEDGDTAEGYGILSILKIPSVFLAALSIAICASTLAFLSATLEPHLRQFALTPVQTGLMFIINGGVYAMSAPILGYICDKLQKPALISLFGAFLIFVSFLIIGPAPFVPLNTMLWLTGVGLGIHGIGLAGTFVAGFISALRDSMDYGLPDNISTYGVVSGLWTSTLSLGAFVGPSIGGVLLDQFGFRNASYYPLGAELCLLILLTLFLVIKPSKNSPTDTESAPLLRPNSPLGEKKNLEVPTTSTGYGATGESKA